MSISIAWQAQDGSEHEVEFGGPHDGSRQASESPGATHFSITRVNDSTLDSAAFLDGQKVAYARRCASPDGRLLATVQVGYRPDGSSFRNFQVYRKAP